MVHAIIDKRSNDAGSVAYVQNGSMRRETDYAKADAVDRRRASMPRHTRAVMSSNARSTD
jgi:hypothetical protein